MNLGKNIKKLRIQKNMTQEDLADLLNTTAKSVSRWESEVTYPDIILLPLLANIFEVTVDELLDTEIIKQDEYLIELKKKAFEYQNNNDYEKELTLWQEAYKKLPNNEEIKINLISIMNTFNIITNTNTFYNEILKLAKSILEKSTNNINRIFTTKELVDLYSYTDNIEMAEFYAKSLPRDSSLTFDVMRTRYLKGDDLLKAIQRNISEFIDEIVRESEFIIYDNRLNLSNDYKKEYLERLIKIKELVYVKDGDYGYDAVSTIFNYIELAKLEIKTTNNKQKVLSYLNEVNKPINYIINFKPHMNLSPFMNKHKCDSIGSYCKVLEDLKNNILKELNNSIFNEYVNFNEYNDLIKLVNNI